jgi:hypothetical protein
MKRLRICSAVDSLPPNGGGTSAKIVRSGGCRQSITRLDQARCVVPRERRADHELDLVKQHQRDDDEPDVPGEQQASDRDPIDETFL